MAPPTGQGPAVGGAVTDLATVAPADARPNLSIVRPRRRLRPGLIGTVVICLVFGTLFVLAAMQAVLVQGQLRLDRVHHDIETRQEALDKLATEVATLEAPDRIQRAATEFGMVQPPDVVFLAPTTVDVLPPDPAPVDGATAPGAEAGTATPPATASASTATTATTPAATGAGA
jgi:hypothetical protein